MTAVLTAARPVGANIRQACELLDAEGPMTLAALAQAMSMPPSYVRKYCKRAEGYGLLTWDGDTFDIVPGWAVLAAGRNVRLPVTARPARGIYIRPPAAVWELSHSRQIANRWPPASNAGRRYSPLGSWDDDTNETNRRSAA